MRISWAAEIAQRADRKNRRRRYGKVQLMMRPSSHTGVQSKGQRQNSPSCREMAAVAPKVCRRTDRAAKDCRSQVGLTPFSEVRGVLFTVFSLFAVVAE